MGETLWRKVQLGICWAGGFQWTTVRLSGSAWKVIAEVCWSPEIPLPTTKLVNKSGVAWKLIADGVSLHCLSLLLTPGQDFASRCLQIYLWWCHWDYQKPPDRLLIMTNRHLSFPIDCLSLQIERLSLQIESLSLQTERLPFQISGLSFQIRGFCEDNIPSTRKRSWFPI